MKIVLKLFQYSSKLNHNQCYIASYDIASHATCTMTVSWLVYGLSAIRRMLELILKPHTVKLQSLYTYRFILLNFTMNAFLTAHVSCAWLFYYSYDFFIKVQYIEERNLRL